MIERRHLADDALSVTARIPLVNLAFEVKAHCCAHLFLNHFLYLFAFDAGFRFACGARRVTGLRMIDFFYGTGHKPAAFGKEFNSERWG
jgi:hypothetical protein